MNKTKSHISIKTKIVISFFLATIIVVGIGLLAYNSLTNLLYTINLESQPDLKLETLEDVIEDLTNAENGVRAYTITRNPDYLHPYYASIANIDRKISQLEYLSLEDSAQLVQIDTIEQLIEDKFLILNVLIALKEDDRVQSVLDKVSENIALAEKKEENTRLVKPGIFKKIFGAGKNKKSEEDIKVASGDIREAVSAIEKEEENAGIVQTNLELELFNKDKLISEQIRGLLEGMEAREVELSKARAAEAAGNTAQTIKIIKAICLFAFLLFLLLIYMLFIDITRRTRYRNILQQARVKAEKLAKAKEEFLSNMSHEIRTPLNAIVGFTEQLGHTRLSQEQKMFVKTIQSSSGHLQVLINDILDYSRIESGKLSLEKVGFKPYDIVKEVNLLLGPKALDKNISFTYYIKKEVPEVLLGDPVRLKQILLNLADNAIKFTKSGGVSIHCGSEDVSDNEINLIVEVKDSGVGIPANKLEDIFNSFDQVDSSVTRKYGGTGLGLAITKKLVEMQLGTIKVKSIENKGSIFIFSIPYQKGDTSQLTNDDQLDTGFYESLNDLSVLIADDEEYNLLLVKNILEKRGMAIELAGSGKEVIQRLKEKPYDVLLLDIQMPGMSGIETARYIRRHFKGPQAQMPIIALTAGTGEQKIRKCLKAGMNDVLMKPFKEKDLLEKILETVNEKNDINGLQPGGGPIIENKSDNYDLQALYALANDDKTFMIEMLEIFVSNSKKGVESMEKHLKEENWVKIRAEAHKIIPSFKHLGLTNLADSLKNIEDVTLEKDPSKKVPGLLAGLSAKLNTILRQLEKEIETLKLSDHV